jgi:hypothetical protein
VEMFGEGGKILGRCGSLDNPLKSTTWHIHVRTVVIYDCTTHPISFLAKTLLLAEIASEMNKYSITISIFELIK